MNPPPLTHLQVTAKDMPEVDRVLKCALPIVIVSTACPEAPGIHGTCFAVRWRGRSVFVTARHVVRNIALARVEVPTSFSVNETCTIREVVSPAEEDARLSEACDVAAMYPLKEPRYVSGESEPLDLDTVRCARLDHLESKALFALGGYPRADPDKNFVDYERNRIGFNLFHAVGAYFGPGLHEGCHLLEVSTVDVGGSDGLSGSPVFCVTRGPDGAFTPWFAGVTTRGNAEKIQFVDVAWLGRFLMDSVFSGQPEADHDALRDPARKE